MSSTTKLPPYLVPHRDAHNRLLTTQTLPCAYPAGITLLFFVVCYMCMVTLDRYSQQMYFKLTCSCGSSIHQSCSLLTPCLSHEKQSDSAVQPADSQLPYVKSVALQRHFHLHYTTIGNKILVSQLLETSLQQLCRRNGGRLLCHQHWLHNAFWHGWLALCVPSYGSCQPHHQCSCILCSHRSPTYSQGTCAFCSHRQSLHVSAITHALLCRSHLVRSSCVCLFSRHLANLPLQQTSCQSVMLGQCYIPSKTCLRCMECS